MRAILLASALGGGEGQTKLGEEISGLGDSAVERLPLLLRRRIGRRRRMLRGVLGGSFADAVSFGRSFVVRRQTFDLTSQNIKV